MWKSTKHFRQCLYWAGVVHAAGHPVEGKGEVKGQVNGIFPSKCSKTSRAFTYPPHLEVSRPPHFDGFAVWANVTVRRANGYPDSRLSQGLGIPQRGRLSGGEQVSPMPFNILYTIECRNVGRNWLNSHIVFFPSCDNIFYIFRSILAWQLLTSMMELRSFAALSVSLWTDPIHTILQISIFWYVAGQNHFDHAHGSWLWLAFLFRNFAAGLAGAALLRAC